VTGGLGQILAQILWQRPQDERDAAQREAEETDALVAAALAVTTADDAGRAAFRAASTAIATVVTRYGHPRPLIRGWHEGTRTAVAAHAAHVFGPLEGRDLASPLDYVPLP
jgi:hypothetical protein